MRTNDGRGGRGDGREGSSRIIEAVKAILAPATADVDEGSMESVRLRGSNVVQERLWHEEAVAQIVSSFNSGLQATIDAESTGQLRPWLQGAFATHTRLLTEALLDSQGSIKNHQASRDDEHDLALKRERIKADEDEKRRIARELHDGMGQVLTTAIFSLDMLTLRMPEAPSEEKEALQEVRQALLECTQSLRDITFKLRPPLLEDLGLLATLRWFFRQSRLGEKVKLTWGVTGLEGRLPLPVETAVFRIVQEATNNIMKHSQATEAQVAIDVTRNKVELLIRDNGVGFDAGEGGQQQALSQGLKGMRERAEVLHGEVHIESGHGQGTVVSAAIPLL